MARLATYVHLMGDDAKVYMFGPDDDVPAWAAKRITNPKAWAAEEEQPAPEPKPTRARRAKSAE